MKSESVAELEPDTTPDACEGCGSRDDHHSVECYLGQEKPEHTGPIVEPPDADELEKAHYELIRQSANNISELEERLESAKRLQKIAKDNYDEAAAEHFAMVRRGPDIPPRRYAKKVRLTCDVEADTELGEGFVTIQAGTEFDVQEIKDQSVVVLVQGKANALAIDKYAVIEWQTFAPGSTIAPTATSELPADTTDKDESEDSSVSLPGTLKAEGPWRDVQLDTLFTGAILKRLKKAGLATVGDMSDYSSQGREMDEIPDIGPAAKQKIEDKMLEFFRDNPQE